MLTLVSWSGEENWKGSAIFALQMRQLCDWPGICRDSECTENYVTAASKY